MNNRTYCGNHFKRVVVWITVRSKQSPYVLYVSNQRDAGLSSLFIVLQNHSSSLWLCQSELAARPMDTSKRILLLCHRYT